MKVLITGTSQGIGKAIAEKFLAEKYEVIGFDRNESTIESENYKHFVLDVRDYDKFPEINDVDILINNAGISQIKLFSDIPSGFDHAL